RAFGLLAGIVVDAGYRKGAAIRIDGDGAAAIVKRVLGLRGGARQQEHGDSETLFHYDLLSRNPQNPKLPGGGFTQRDPDHFQTISRVLAALVQIRLAQFNLRPKGGQFPDKSGASRQRINRARICSSKNGSFANVGDATPRYGHCVPDSRGASSRHFALQLLEAPASFAFAIVDELDRCVPAQRPADARV